MPTFSGLIAAAHTPFDAQGRLNLAVIEDQMHLFRKSGVSGTFICGTTGEGASLSSAERREVARQWVEAADEEFPVIVHVGHNSQVEAVELAAHAQRIGADAVAALAPSYFKPDTVGDLIAFLKPIAAAAPELPFFFYDIPGMSGVQLATDRLLEEGRSHIPTLAGVKYSSYDLMRLQECLRCGEGAFTVLYGSDEVLLAALALGAHGAVGSTYNVAAPLYLNMIEAFESGHWEKARMLQFEAVRLVRALIRYGVIRSTKALMGRMGVACGPVRAPLCPLAPEEKGALFREADALSGWARPFRVS